MKKSIKEYFVFTRSERNGFIILIFLIIILIATKQILPVLLSKKTIDYSEWDEEIVEFEKALLYTKDHSDRKGNAAEYYSSLYDTITLYHFDPNTMSKEQWMSFGLSEKQTNTILKYRAKGGKFYRKEDLKKIYTISDTQYEYLAPYITISGNIGEKDTGKYAASDNKTQIISTKSMIELNSADSIQLLSLPGIGPVFAGRIIKYRNLLGGYYNKEQLLEVYYFTQENLNTIYDAIKVDTSKIFKIDLNTATYFQFIKHPYLNKFQVNSILAYRDYVGRINNMNELSDSNILDGEVYHQLTPYLQIK